jgi:hypothetical protein
MATPKLRILLSGMIAGVPRQGGATRAVLQYPLGLRRLGHDIRFVEPVEEALRPAGAPLARSDIAAYFRRVMAGLGMGHSSALLLAGTRQTVGLPYDRLRESARRADVLVNISGLLADEALTESVDGSEPARRIGSAVALARAEATANPNLRNRSSLWPEHRHLPAGLVAPSEGKPKGAADARGR